MSWTGSSRDSLIYAWRLFRIATLKCEATIFQALVNLYKNNIDGINCIQTMIWFIKIPIEIYGIYSIIKYILNANFIRKREEIDSDLKIRNQIESSLQSYVFKENRNGRKDIGVRFVFCESYPENVEHDGYKQYLKIEYHDKQIIGSSWLDKTGIFFEENIWYSGDSIYIDSNKIFFVARKGQHYERFTEYKNKRIIKHLPFTNIINVDFKEIIEYEPVFYTKYPYIDKKLYSPLYIVRERVDDEYLQIELEAKKLLTRYTWTRYMLLQLKLNLIRLFRL